MVAALETRDIRKVYPGTLALDGVSIAFQPGQVHALLGKNGAGKSTLVRILSGATTPTSGSVLISGQPIRFPSPRDALRCGIATVHQELGIVPGLSVAENILLGRWPRRGAVRPAIDWRRLEDRAAQLLREIHVSLDLRAPAGRLSVGQQQMVEIARAISVDATVLMLDEPTSALARHEVQQLFAIVRRLAARGVAIVYVTHRLQELREIADCATILRDGRVAGSLSTAEANPKAIADLMFGAAVPESAPASHAAAVAPLLEVEGLSAAGRLEDVSFTVGRGEIVGIAGMLGAGRSTLLRSIFGAVPVEGGRVRLDGRRIDTASPRAARRAGLAFTPEDRKRQGLVLGMSVRDNLCLAGLERIARCGLISRRLQRPFVDRSIRELHIAAADPERSVALLSGGNQQKVVLGNWLNTDPRMILLDEPTRGIDIQAKQQIFEIIRGLSRRGVGVLVVSSELEELLAICHRILVLRGGRITAECAPRETPIDRLLALCMEA